MYLKMFFFFTTFEIGASLIFLSGALKKCIVFMTFKPHKVVRGMRQCSASSTTVKFFHLHSSIHTQPCSQAPPSFPSLAVQKIGREPATRIIYTFWSEFGIIIFELCQATLSQQCKLVYHLLISCVLMLYIVVYCRVTWQGL